MTPERTIEAAAELLLTPPTNDAVTIDAICELFGCVRAELPEADPHRVFRTARDAVRRALAMGAHVHPRRDRALGVLCERGGA